MSEISRAALFGKLNSLGYKTIESATVFCKLRGNPHVEMAHWLFQILQAPDSDLVRIIRQYEIDAARLAADLTRSLDGLPRGATSISDFSPHIDDAAERAWVYATLLFKETAVRTGHLLVGMLKTNALRNQLFAISPEFKKIKTEALCEDYARITSGSAEDKLPSKDGFQVGGGAVREVTPVRHLPGDVVGDAADREVREGVRIVNRVGFDRNVSEWEESIIHAVGCSDIGFEPHLWRSQSVIVRVEENRDWSWRSEVLRNIWPENIIGRNAVRTSGGTVTERYRHQIRRVFGRAAIAGAVAEVNVLEKVRGICRRGRVRTADNHLTLWAG